MNIVESHLILAAPPVSIKKFDDYKTEYPELYAMASIYIIVKRPVPEIRIIGEDELEGFLEIEGVDDNNPDYQKVIKDAARFIKGGKAVALEITQANSNNRIRGIYELPDSMGIDDFRKDLSEIDFEEILYCSSQGVGAFGCRDDVAPFLTYEVMYVGHCVGEPLTKRFKAHHALQKMLIHEKVISKEYSNSDELMILPFYSSADTISVLTGETKEDEWIKAFTNDFSYGTKEVNLDCEKALVHGMNPKYNSIKFNKYPKSDDGLYNSEAEVYCYTIAANMILKYEHGFVYGAGDGIYASKIVGDKLDNKVTIYDPGENYTLKYAERVFPYYPVKDSQ